jgi:hypothetical protein
VAVSAATVNLAWNPVQDGRLTGYELGWGSASSAYSQYQQTAGSTGTLELADPGPWYIAVRALGSDAGTPIRSEWSNEVIWRLDAGLPTYPLSQVGIWSQFELVEPVMAIPASVTLYTNWVHGALVSTTYTQATPEIPNAHTWTFDGSIAAEAASPWNGQYLADFTADWNDHAVTTVSASTFAASAGRLLVEVQTGAADYPRILTASAAIPSYGLLLVRNVGGNLQISLDWNDYNHLAEVNLGTFPTSPFALEIIYDTLNATRAQRLQARVWAIGGTPPGSFTAAGYTWGGSSVATNQFTSLSLGTSDDTSNVLIGRVIVSNSITEDLSAASESGAASIVPILTRQYASHWK